MNSSKNPKILNKSNIINAIIIIAVSCGVSILYNSLLPNSLPWIYKEKVVPTISDSLLFLSSQNDTNKTKSITQSMGTISAKENTKVTTNEESNKIDNKSQSKAQEQLANNNEKNEIKTISYSQLLKILDNPNFIIIDARREDEFNKGHITGAINIYALDDPDIRVPKMMNLDMSKTLIVYCDGGHCDLSHQLVQELSEVMHFKKVFLFAGGWEEWIKNQGTKS